MSCDKNSKCNGDQTNNVWVEDGVCLLDNLTDTQVVYILERDEVARADLKKVTTDPHLLNLANTVPRLPTGEFADLLQSEQNRNKDTIPFYSVFRGQGPYNG